MSLFYKIGLSFTVLLYTCNGNAQVSPGLDQELQETLDSMRTVLGAKSLSAAIQTANGSIWADATGISSAMPISNVTTNDVYLIGSVTKTITSACVLQLADEGLLNLDDSLYEWLPTMPYIDTTITIRQLLNHTSGIFDVLAHPHQQDSLLADISRIWTPEELIDRFISPPIFAAGTSWSYSNTNYFLLSMIIKEATGNDFYTELRDRFFDPLNLGSFAIPAFENLNSPVAHCWMDITGDGVLDDANNFYMNYLALNSTAGAAGGYFSTPTDCTKWMRSYMRGDVISAAMLNEAKTVVNAPGAQGGKYGLGLMKNQTSFLGHLAYGHGGDLAYHASSWYFPALDQSITVFTNDNSETSWTLLPVVKELLRTYIDHQDLSVEAEGFKELTVSPNPFNDQITVSYISIAEEEVTISLKDATRRIINVQTSNQLTPINANNKFKSRVEGLEFLSSGSYFLEVTGSTGWSKTFKMSK